MDGISNYSNFLLLHRPQLVSSGIPEHFWEVLCKKLNYQTFDAGDAFSLLLIDYSEVERSDEDPIWTVAVSKENGIRKDDPREIYIIDHAWTFRFDMARAQLQQIPELLNRMSMIMGIDTEQSNEECMQQVMTNIWKYCQMYAIGGSDELSVENRMPIWYVMDELGCGINHSDTPNFRVVPFMFMPEQITFSVLFPIEDSAEDDYVTRDYVEGSGRNENIRNALLLPWKQNVFTDIEYLQREPEADYFLAGHVEESLPIEGAIAPIVDSSRPLKVFATYRYVHEYLNDTGFEMVEREEDADILWLTTHFKNYNELSTNTPNKFVNQFPFENVVTIKDLLATVCRRISDKHSDNDTLETFPKWLPTTYNLKTELLEFVSYYQHRMNANLDNHWIIKPWNLARGLDMHITKDLKQIMRLQPTGPKIAQKYVENPVLFDRPEVGGKVKFDVRYVILLSDVAPLNAYIYKNFFLRFANKPFQLNRFDDYQQHFTVMNYAQDFELRHIPCAEFLEFWQQQYPKYDWTDVEDDICVMIKEMLLGATSKPTPCGIGKSVQSRALYAADIMLSWEDGKIQPKLLEVNWGPDCKRACEYYPQFYNDVFKLLFKNEMNEDVFKKITTNK